MRRIANAERTAETPINSLHDLIDHLAQVTGGTIILPAATYRIGCTLEVGLLRLTGVDLHEQPHVVVEVATETLDHEGNGGSDTGALHQD